MINSDIVPVERQTLVANDNDDDIDDTDAELESEFTTYSQLILTVTLPLCLFIIFYISKSIKHINGYHMISLILFLLILFWNICFFRAIFSFKHLHFIKIKRKRLQNAKRLFISYGYEEKKNMPLLSVSAISALRGSNIERIIIILMYLTFGLVLSAVCMKWVETKNEKIKIELILLLICTYGCFLIATWNTGKSKYNINNIIHYLSTTLSIILGPLSFCLQQQWNIISIILMVITNLSLFLWLFMMFTVSKSYDDYRKVHRISLYSLIFEVFVLMCAYSSIILFVYSMGNENMLIID